MYERRPKVVIHHTSEVAKQCKALSELETPEDFFWLYDSKLQKSAMCHIRDVFDWEVVLKYRNDGTFEIVDHNGEGTSQFMWFTQVDDLEVICEVLFLS